MYVSFSTLRKKKHFVSFSRTLCAILFHRILVDYYLLCARFHFFLCALVYIFFLFSFYIDHFGSDNISSLRILWRIPSTPTHENYTHYYYVSHLYICYPSFRAFNLFFCVLCVLMFVSTMWYVCVQKAFRFVGFFVLFYGRKNAWFLSVFFSLDIFFSVHSSNSIVEIFGNKQAFFPFFSFWVLTVCLYGTVYGWICLAACCRTWI